MLDHPVAIMLIISAILIPALLIALEKKPMLYPVYGHIPDGVLVKVWGIDYTMTGRVSHMSTKQYLYLDHGAFMLDRNTINTIEKVEEK